MDVIQVPVYYVTRLRKADKADKQNRINSLLSRLFDQLPVRRVEITASRVCCTFPLSPTQLLHLKQENFRDDGNDDQRLLLGMKKEYLEFIENCKQKVH